MADGICDVENCQRETYMGWRPLAVAEGRQVCNYHWNLHKDSTSTFNLFIAFCLKRPPAESGTKFTEQPGLCVCGEKLLPGYRFCKKCAGERELERKRQYYHQKKDDELLHRVSGSDFEGNVPRCKDCGNERLPGHSYCRKCGRSHSQKSNRERQRRYRKKHRFAKRLNVTVLACENRGSWGQKQGKNLAL